MKVLFSGAWNPAFEAMPEYVASALLDAGHIVRRFDHRDYHLPGRLRNTIPLLDRIDRASLNRRLFLLAAEFRPDLLLVNQGASISPSTVLRIRQETGAATVNWWSDYPAEFEDGLVLARSGAYDRFFVSGNDARDRHLRSGASGTLWLPFGCDPRIHPAAIRRNEDETSCRIAFVGSAYPERRDLLAGLADLGLGIWGPGWDRYRDDPVIGSAIRGEAVRPSEWVAIYHGADVVMNVSYGFGGDPEVYGTTANVRVFEALSCSACLLTDAKADILHLFRDGVHLSAYRTAAEARRTAEDLLESGERRARIADAGRREVHLHHTWRDRVDRILHSLRGAPEILLRQGGMR